MCSEFLPPTSIFCYLTSVFCHLFFKELIDEKSKPKKYGIVINAAHVSFAKCAWSLVRLRTMCRPIINYRDFMGQLPTDVSKIIREVNRQRLKGDFLGEIAFADRKGTDSKKQKGHPLQSKNALFNRIR